MSNSEPWYGPIRAIHDEHFHDPWEERLTELNARFGLQGDDVFLTHGPGLPPPWFNGDIEAIAQRQHLVDDPGPELDIAIDGGDAFESDFGRTEEEGEGEDVVDIGPDIGIEDHAMGGGRDWVVG